VKIAYSVKDPQRCVALIERNQKLFKRIHNGVEYEAPPENLNDFDALHREMDKQKKRNIEMNRKRSKPPVMVTYCPFDYKKITVTDDQDADVAIFVYAATKCEKVPVELQASLKKRYADWLDTKDPSLVWI
jgi:hypothetical protein